MDRIKTVINIILVTSIVGMAISYFTILVPVLPKLNFLEAVGIYCIWTPINHLISGLVSENNDD